MIEPSAPTEPQTVGASAASDWREDREDRWYNDIGYQFQGVLAAHLYVYADKGGRPADSGWHACSCGSWEGYWSGFHSHVADMLRLVAMATDTSMSG